MLSKSVVALVATVTGALAATPPGFEPASENSLPVTFGNVAALDGVEVEKAATASAPSIGTQSKLDGTSFAVIMVDLDIPTDNPPATSTLLHWMQTGLTQSSSATVLNTTTGTLSAYLLSVANGQTAFASYIGPAPPARIPLSHRYTEILIDTSDATDDGLATLQTAAANRSGFSAEDVLTQAGLVDKVVAGNFFNVTNPGPVTNASSSTKGPGSSGSSSGNGSGSSDSPARAAAMAQRASGPLLVMTLVGALVFGL
ncbi:PEBP-like protein [Xylariaceae sp. FL1019]|nr:PEBP-like protein [Xylariaceae sp. FL1019]